MDNNTTTTSNITSGTINNDNPYIYIYMYVYTHVYLYIYVNYCIHKFLHF